MRSRRVATLNLGDNRRATGRDIRALLHEGARVIALQEAFDRTTRLMFLKTRKGLRGRLWRFTRAAAGAAEVPILRRRVRGRQHARTATRTRIWGRGAGGGQDGRHGTPKAVVWDVFDAWALVNVHLIPSVRYPEREALYRAHIATVVSVVKSLQARNIPVALVGDFNVPPGHPLLDPLRDLGMTQHVRFPTHGVETLDHVWSWRLDISQVRPGPKVSSDHKAVLFTVTW